MSCFRRRNIKNSKLLGSNAYTSCFSFDQSVEQHQFDDHLINHIPIVQISNLLLKTTNESKGKKTLPDLQCIKSKSMVQNHNQNFQELSTASPINSCESFEKYHEVTHQQSLFFSTQLEPATLKSSFRCHSLRKYSGELQNINFSPNLSVSGIKSETKKTNRPSSLTKYQLQSSNKTASVPQPSRWKKYSHREVTKGINKQKSNWSKQGQLSPWIMMESSNSLF